jgi:hypothetical protein
MARTTLVIEDGLLRQIKKKAAEEGRSFQSLANDLLRRALAMTTHKPYRLDWEGWDAEQLPGVNILDRDTLFDLMNGR